MTHQDQAPEWDRTAVVRAYVGETRDCGPGRAGPRVIAGLVIVVLVMAVSVLVGYVSRPAARQSPQPGISPSAQVTSPSTTPLPRPSKTPRAGRS